MKKILLVFFVALLGATTYGQIDSLTAAGTDSHRQVRHKINATLTQVNKNVDTLTVYRTRLDNGVDTMAAHRARIEAVESDLVDTVDLASLAPLLTDVRPLFVFGAGVGLVADSALFQTTSDYGGFFNKGTDSLVVTSINCYMINGAGNDTLSIAVQWHATYNSGSATSLNTTALPIGRPNALTTGTEDTSFNNSVIPPNVWVWMETPYVLAANKPYGLRVTLSGYRK